VVDALTPAGRVSDEVRALLYLDALPGVGPRALNAIVSHFGSAERALRAPRSHFARAAGRDAAAARDRLDARDAVDAALVVADRMGMRVLDWAHPAYPPRFRHLADPPPVLFLRGRAELLAGPAVTIVGARRATARAREVSERLGRALAARGIVVVSGLALGVDAAAHTGALSGGGDTVAVMGRGADRAYPRTHARLFRDIVGRGLVISEFLPGTPALPHHFPRRNRLLAALGEAVVVVEAARKSGSLITVEHALDLGLDVYAVPGPIDEPVAAGSNALLADGARALVSIDRFVRERFGDADAEAVPVAPPEGVAGRLWTRLGERPTHVEELASGAGVGIPEALVALSSLELEGRVRQAPGMRFRRAG
jgi:DNA processing protein